MKTLLPISVVGLCLSGCTVGAAEFLIGEEPLVVVGDGNSTTAHALPPVTVKGGEAYAFSWEQRVDGVGGAPTAGSSLANLGASAPRDGRWHPGMSLIVMPTRGESFEERLSFGQWMIKGEAAFRNARLEPLKTKYASLGEVSLGHGERLEKRTYTFFAPCGTDGWLKARTLFAFDCGYQGALWWFDKANSFVTYRHDVAGRRFLRAKVFAGPSEWRGGAGEVTLEVSTDGRLWRRLGGVTPTRSGSFSVPNALFPCSDLFVRLRGGKGVSVQVSHYAVEAELDGDCGFLTGATTFLSPNGKIHAEIGANPFYDDFGERLEAGDEAVLLWRATSGRKVPRRRLPPTVTVRGLELKAAANESEAAQLVVCPKDSLADVRVTADFPLPVEVLRVGYVKVEYPSDGFGIFGDVPDPLPPQDARPVVVRAGENQPFWVRIRVPKQTKAGTYCGTLSVVVQPAAGGASKSYSVPLSVEVFGFALPDETACETAFGCTLSEVAPYYNPDWATSAHRRLAERSLSMLAEHRISPYLPAPIDGFRCEFRNGKVVFDWAVWDRAIDAALRKYHFNTFLVPLSGLGACSMSSQSEPVFFGHRRNEPGYDELVGAYLAEIERHLVEKGWIDKAYVYLYDEPMPEHYALVKWGFGLLKRYAPRIRRMLPVTKPPATELGDAANLWCIATYSLRSPQTDLRRAAGDGIWWYVCNNPKAPYAADFIDRPTADLRTWLWQTWGENVAGILIWETLHWETYRDGRGKGCLQDVWQDPMTWCGAGSVATGNGEGRLLYPPSDWRENPASWERGFVGSIRLEHLRDGLEDHLYLSLLRKRNPNHPLLDVPETIYSSVNSFAVDPAGMERRRQELAEALQR